MTVTINSSSKRKSWRLVYANGVVKQLFESSGVTKTINSLYESTPTDGASDAVTSVVGNQQCIAFIAANKLTLPAIT